MYFVIYDMLTCIHGGICYNKKPVKIINPIYGIIKSEAWPFFMAER